MSTSYYRTEVSVEVAGDPNFKQIEFGRSRMVREEQYAVGSQVVNKAIAAGASYTFDTSIVSSPKIVYIEADGALLVKFNGAAAGFNLAPTAGQKSTIWVDGATITSVQLSNSGTGTVNIKGVMVG